MIWHSDTTDRAPFNNPTTAEGRDCATLIDSELQQPTMIWHSDTTDRAPLNNPTTTEGRYGSTLTSDGAASSSNHSSGTRTMIWHSDTNDRAPFNNPTTAEGRHGSTLTSDGAASSSNHSSGTRTRTGLETRSVGGRANNSLQDTPADVSSRLRGRWGSRITNYIVDAVHVGLQAALIWGKRNFFSLVDVALIVAGICVLVLHRHDEDSVCQFVGQRCEVWEYATPGFYSRIFRCTKYVPWPREFNFSEAWRLWAAGTIVLKTIITVTRVGRWCRDPRHESTQVFEWGLQSLNAFHGLCVATVTEVTLTNHKSCARDKIDEPSFQMCLVFLFLFIFLITVPIFIVKLETPSWGINGASDS
eukprot:g10789.t1